jgi:hypothetical protein
MCMKSIYVYTQTLLAISVHSEPLTLNSMVPRHPNLQSEITAFIRSHFLLTSTQPLAKSLGNLREVLAILGFELGVLHLLGKCSII